MKMLALTIEDDSRLEDLTSSAKAALDQIYGCTSESFSLVMQCECSGVSNAKEESVKDITAWEKVLRQLEMCRANTLFIAKGDVFGPSFDLLLISDFRIISQRSQVSFSQLKEHTIPTMSIYRLVNQIGQAQARKLCLTGKSLGAEEACRLGLADETVEDTSQALERFNIITGSETAVCRRLILEAHATSYDDALGAYWAARARRGSGSFA